MNKLVVEELYRHITGRCSRVISKIQQISITGDPAVSIHTARQFNYDCTAPVTPLHDRIMEVLTINGFDVPRESVEKILSQKNIADIMRILNSKQGVNAERPEDSNIIVNVDECRLMEMLSSLVTPLVSELELCDLNRKQDNTVQPKNEVMTPPSPATIAAVFIIVIFITGLTCIAIPSPRVHVPISVQRPPRRIEEGLNLGRF